MNYNISNTILIVILLIFFTLIVYFIYDNYIQYMFVQEGLSNDMYAAIKDMNNPKYSTTYAFRHTPHHFKQDIKFKQVVTGDGTDKIVFLGEDSIVYTTKDRVNLTKDNTETKMNYVTMTPDGKTLWGIDTTNDIEGGKVFKYDTTKAAPPKIPPQYLQDQKDIERFWLFGKYIRSYRSSIPVRKIVLISSDEWVYIAEDGGYLKMVNNKKQGRYSQQEYKDNLDFVNIWKSSSERDATDGYKLEKINLPSGYLDAKKKVADSGLEMYGPAIEKNLKGRLIDGVFLINKKNEWAYYFNNKDNTGHMKMVSNNGTEKNMLMKPNLYPWDAWDKGNNAGSNNYMVRNTYSEAVKNISATVMYGPWIGTPLAVRNIVKKSDNEWIYVAYDGKYLKMVSSYGEGGTIGKNAKYVETSYDNNRNFINEWNKGTTANNNYKIKVKPMLTGTNQNCYMKELSYGKSNACRHTHVSDKKGRWWQDHYNDSWKRPNPKACWQRARDHENWCGGKSQFTYKFGNQEGFNGMEGLDEEDEEDERIEPFITGGRWVEVGGDERYVTLNIGPNAIQAVNKSGKGFIHKGFDKFNKWESKTRGHKQLIARNSGQYYYYLDREGRFGAIDNDTDKGIKTFKPEMTQIDFSTTLNKLVGIDKQGIAYFWEGRWKEILFPGSMTFKSIGFWTSGGGMIWAIGTDGKLYMANKTTRSSYKTHLDNRNKQIEEDARKAKEEADKKAEEERKAKAKAEEERKAAEEAAAAAAAEDARKAKEEADRKAAAEKEAQRLAEEARIAAEAAAAKARAETDEIKKRLLELEARVARNDKDRADRAAASAKAEAEAAKANAKAKLLLKDTLTKQFNAVDSKIDVLDKKNKEDNKTIYSRMLGNDYKVYNALKHNISLAEKDAIMKGSYDAQVKLTEEQQKYRSSLEERIKKQDEEKERKRKENESKWASGPTHVQAKQTPLPQSVEFNLRTNQIDKVHN